MPVLFAFREDRFGFRFDVGDHAVLGRAPECDLILFDRGTSRRHAEIYLKNGTYYLRDLKSTNGTLHNEVQVDGEVPLKSNDEIKVGQEIFLFDPDLDVAVGPEGAVLVVGDVEIDPAGSLILPTDLDLANLERNYLAPLYQIAVALSSRPKEGRVLKQAAYALSKLFLANDIVLLWPKTGMSRNLTTLLSRPRDTRQILPRPLVETVIQEGQAVIWPHTISRLDFVKGERILDEQENSAMAVPLNAGNNLNGLIYVSSQTRRYSAKDLNFLLALGSLLSSALGNAGLIGQLDYRVAQDEEELNGSGDFVGDSPQVKALLGTVSQIALNESRILVNGEVGTGKEVVARRIHGLSPRRRGPFIVINCSAHPPGQIESILLGDELGAITDFTASGALERAEGGTLFLRHVDHLPLSAQVELLRAIEEGVVYRIGSQTPRPINVRLITSTVADLDLLVEKGEFREDLYSRISEMQLSMPPLRENREDISRLTRHFLSQAALVHGVAAPELDPAVIDCFESYPWPGNISELKNYSERMVIFAVNDRIVLEDLTPELRFSMDAFRSGVGQAASHTVAEVERILIRRAMARSNGSLSSVARMLEINEEDLASLIQRYNISVE